MLKASVAFGASCLALVGAAAADTDGEDPRDARIRELEERLDRLEAATPAQADPVRVTLNNGRPTIQADDARFSVRSLVQLDAAIYDQDGSAPQDLSSGTNFRRARLGVDGQIDSDWKYELMFEFGGSGQEDPGKVIAGWIEYAGFGPWRVRLGAQAPSAGLDDSTSAGDLPFLERAAAAEMARGVAAGDGRIAATLSRGGAHWFGSAAMTGAVAGSSASYDEQLGFVTRIAAAPIHTDAFTLHLGANYTDVRNLPDSSAGAGLDWAQLRERPELRVDGARLVDTGQLSAEGLTVTGVEAGLQWGRLHASGEYILFDVDRAGALPDAEFNGWHVQAVWSLTGEARRWSNKNGGFASQRPNANFDPDAGEWGAWELAGRYSVLDLNDNDTTPGAANTLGAPNAIVRGGEQQITTLGLNWRPNPVLRFMLNFQSTEVERFDAAGLTDIGQSFEAVSLRSQLAF